MRCFGVESVDLGLASVLTLSALLLTGCGASAQPREPVEPTPLPSEPSPAESCRYTTLVPARNHPDYVDVFSPADRAISSRVESAFSKELESVGFRRVADVDAAWWYLDVMLLKSRFNSNVVVGSVSVQATSALTRDAQLALEEGAYVGRGLGGMFSVEERVTHRGEFVDREKFEIYLRTTAREIWRNTEPILDMLCSWEATLTEDGLTVNELRRELVKEMARVRRRYREEKQRKKLELEIEE